MEDFAISATQTHEERLANRSLGLVPPAVESLQHQAKRVLQQMRDLASDFHKYAFLQEVAASSKVLFYELMLNNVEELMPIVYTPTVGEGCQRFCHLYRHPQGLYFSSFHNRGKFSDILNNWPCECTTELMVVTNGGRILGLGDLGTNGMGISIGKVALYVTAAGFSPYCAIPAVIDCGTNNEELLKDEFYQGERAKRISSDEVMSTVEELLSAVAARCPHCLVQFEDFETDAAVAILDRFRDKYLCFNDDIQGTGAVVLAGLLNGLRVQGTPISEARIVMFGAGSSAVGVALMIIRALELYGNLSREEAFRRIYMVDSKGVLTSERPDVDKLPQHKKPFVRQEGIPAFKKLVDVIHHAKPHALIGLTGSGQAFFEPEVKAMLEYNQQPLIFPLSNPTSKSEISAEDAVRFGEGRVLFAAGSPYKPVEYNGKKYVPSQANNVFVFPGIGFGAIVARARRVTDEMLVAAADAVASFVTEDQLKEGRLFPDIKDLRAVSVEVSSAVAKAACDQGNCDMTDIPTDIRAAVLQHMWQPTPGKKAGVEGQAVATVCGTEPDATAGNLAGEADAQDQASADGGGNYGRGNGGGDNGGWGNGEDGLKHATAGGNGSGTNGASAGASDKARGGVGDNFPAGIADDDEGVAELLKGNYVV
eukprot:jgi/Chrzof1/2666/Cz11g24140.t1